MFAACSSSEEVLTQNTQEPIDEENVTRDGLMGNIPIEFADITGSATVEETRGSASVNGSFKSGTMGIYCVSINKMNASAETPYYLSTKALGKILNVWLENVSAHVEPTQGDNKGYIKWDNPNEKHYYPKKDWYNYGFVAYHPRTDYVTINAHSLVAYMVIDGNDDVFSAISSEPRAELDNTTAAKAYSQQYFEAVGVDNITADHRPYFNFKHMTSRLKFKVKLSSDCERELHVDSICINKFPNIMKLSLIKVDNGVVKSNWNTYSYIRTTADAMPESFLKTIPSAPVKDSEGNITGYNPVILGHYWLREADDSSIGAKVNGEYKYILNTTDYIDVGDCIMIAPVEKEHSKSTVQLEVYLRDNYNNLFTTTVPIAVPAPENGGWKSGTSYTIKVSIGGNIFFMDQTRGLMYGQLDGYTEGSAIEVTDND